MQFLCPVGICVVVSPAQPSSQLVLFVGTILTNSLKLFGISLSQASLRDPFCEDLIAFANVCLISSSLFLN